MCFHTLKFIIVCAFVLISKESKVLFRNPILSICLNGSQNMKALQLNTQKKTVVNFLGINRVNMKRV